MKAISIRQPWVWAIVYAGKDIENRDWSTAYRGPILLHAASGMTRREYSDFIRFYYDDIVTMIDRGAPWPQVPAFNDLQRGGIVGRASIVDCVKSHRSPWFFGSNGLVLADVEPVPFQPLKGSLGLFEVTG